MSTPFTPPATAGAASVTPYGDASGADSNTVRLVPFTSEILDFFVDILDEDNSIRDKLKQGIEYLLTDHWRVKKWNDLKFFSAEDVKLALVPGNGMPEELLAPVIVKKIGCIVDYAQCGVLTADLTLDDIMGQVKKWNRMMSVSTQITGGFSFP